jgi:hypothetical protein
MESTDGSSRTLVSSRTPVAGILAIVGGALVALGSLLAWAEVSGGGTSVTAKGVDGSDGYITLAAGIVAFLVGITMTRQAKRMLAVLAILAGLVGGGVALYDALTAEDSVLDAAAEELAPSLGASAELVRAALDEAIDAGQLSVTISFGLYVVIAGGVVALFGGILGLRGSAEAEAAGGSSSGPPEAVTTAVDVPPTPKPSPAASPPADDGGV